MSSRSLKQNASDLQALCPKTDSCWNAGWYCLWEISKSHFFHSPKEVCLNYLLKMSLTTFAKKFIGRKYIRIHACLWLVVGWRYSKMYACPWLNQMRNVLYYEYFSIAANPGLGPFLQEPEYGLGQSPCIGQYCFCPVFPFYVPFPTF